MFVLRFLLFNILFNFFFFFNDTATTEIYTLSLHDALPIWGARSCPRCSRWSRARRSRRWADRKSTRLNSSHHGISYAVFCLKKKNQKKERNRAKERARGNRAQHTVQSEA